MKALPFIIKDKSYVPCKPEEATHIQLEMPGPIGYLMLPVIMRGTRKGTHCWTWNGDTEKPTLKPSILTKTRKHRCHSFVNDGKVRFLNDCTHEFAGQTLDLLDIEE